MINGKLQDFAASAMARGQISFGDVRRLQRDCLPPGITTREEADCLIALDAALARADKAWAAWLVPALAEFVAAHQAADVADAGAAGPSLQTLFAQSPSAAALGRKIARHIRRQSAQPHADESADAQPRRRRKPRTCKVDAVRRTGAAKKIAPIVASQIKLRPVTPGKRRSTCVASLPCEIWSAGIMEKHLRFQLARPAA